MVTIPTNNPVPSTAPQDLKFNAEKMDLIVSSQEKSYTDRKGASRKTWAAIESGFDEIISSLDSAGVITVPDVDSGLVATSNGQYFRKINGSGDDIAFVYYRNINGAAVEITSVVSSDKVEAISADIIALIQKTMSLGESEDSVFDIATKNGVRVFRIRDDLKAELSEIVNLKTGDSGLTFSGNAIDNNTPPGWAFIIHSTNGLVIAGVKDDGTKVGFGGGNSGGGQSGEIIPGDTAATYDAIRQYSGTSTVKDVVGNRIAGRFVVDASDTSSPDDGGGCLVDILGRRWKRQADYVTYDMFSAPRVPEDVYNAFSRLLANGDFSGAAAMIATYSYADSQIAACHSYANKLRIPVVQNDGVFLWKSGEIDVRTNSYLSGATLVTTDESGVDEIRWGPYRGVDESAPEPVRQYVINGKPRIELNASQLNQLNTTYSSYLKRGSTMLPMPDLAAYRGGMLFLLSSEVDYIRYGQSENIRNTVLVRDYSIIGKAGALSDRLEKTFSPGSVIYAAITQKENSFLNFYPPKFHETGKNRRFVNITQYRAMVNIFDQVHHDNGNGASASRVVYKAVETFECNLIRGQIEGSHLNDGAYGIGFRDCLSATIHRYYGEYGWGLNGHHGIKKIITSENKWNRFDIHSFGVDIVSTNDEVKGTGINMQGSGKWKFTNIKHVVPSTDNSGRFEQMQNGLFFPREDYSSDCDIELEIDGLLVQFDSTNPNWYSAATHSYDVVRLLGNDSVDNGSDTRTPVVIRGKNITFDLEGVQKLGVNTEDFVFSFVRSARSEKTDYDTTGRRTYLPDVIDVDGMTAINVPAGKNAWMNIIKMPDTLYQNYNGSRNPLRADGTNARISGRNVHSVVNSPVVTRGYNNTVSLPGDSANWNASYLNNPNAWVPDIHLDNCSPVLVDMRGTRGRLTVTGGVLSRFEAPVSGVSAKAVGVTAQLYPDASGQTYLSSGSMVFFGSQWMNPAGGAVYNGALRGAANENRGDTSKAPNIPSSVFI